MRATITAKELQQAGVVLLLGNNGFKPKDEIPLCDLNKYDRSLADQWLRENKK